MGMLAGSVETAVTWDRFEQLHVGVTAALEEAGRAACGRVLVACRFAYVYPDGPAPYYTFVAPARAGAELEQWDAIKNAVSRAILDHGGTITHHHAVGRDHRPWYDEERPELFAEALRAAKRTLDPGGILNPGRADRQLAVRVLGVHDGVALAARDQPAVDRERDGAGDQRVRPRGCPRRAGSSGRPPSRPGSSSMIALSTISITAIEIVSEASASGTAAARASPPRSSGSIVSE